MPIPDRLFDPSRSFFSLPVVRWTFAIVAVCAGLSCLAIIASTDLAFDSSANGFNEFLSIFRFPLGVTALLIPVMAIYATNYRSVQQKQQIQLAGAQNEFANYYKHLEEFQKHYLECWFDFELLIMRPGIKPRNYHGLFYKNARTGDYQVDQEFYEKQLNCLIYIIDEFSLIDSVDDPAERFGHFIRAEGTIQNFCSNMYLTYQGRGSDYVDGRVVPRSENYGAEPIKVSFCALQEGVHFFIHLAQFAHNPSYSRYFPVMANLDANAIFDEAYLGHNVLTGKFGFGDAFQRMDRVYKHDLLE